MDPSAGREQHLKYGGFLVAGVGFLLSRTTLLAVADTGGSLFAYLMTGFLPLSLGLVLAVFGVSLAVSTFEPWYVNTVALWTLLGTVGMALVAALSVVNPLLVEGGILSVLSNSLVANTLIGGAVGGALIGLQSARNRRQRRTLARQSKQAIVLNRILRDEILNAITAVRSRVEHVRAAGADEESLAAIDRGTERVRNAVEDVGFLVRSENGDRAIHEPTPLAPVLRDELAAVAEQYPDASIEWQTHLDDGVRVRANDRLGTVVAQLCELAVERHPENAPSLRVTLFSSASLALQGGVKR